MMSPHLSQLWRIAPSIRLAILLSSLAGNLKTNDGAPLTSMEGSFDLFGHEGDGAVRNGLIRSETAPHHWRDIFDGWER